MIGLRRLTDYLSAKAGSIHADRSPLRNPFPAVLIVGGTESAARALSPDWRVLTAGTLAEARELVAGNEFAMALCDRDAPGMDWRQAVPALSAAPSRPCVVLLTASEDSQLWEQVTALGGYDVLRKPATEEALARVIRAGISQWRSSRALEAARPPLRK